MKKIVSLLLTGALALSLAACGGGNAESSETSGEKTAAPQENQSGPIQSKGLFLLERTEGDELDDLTAQETYLIHVYDILPDQSKNVEMGVFESNYSMTMNGVNTYEPLVAPTAFEIDSFSIPSNVDYFMLASGYAAPPELGTVLAGGEPIRSMSVYKINTNDINDDTTATFTVTSCDVYDCELNFTREDIITINRFDDVYQLEENPTDYQIAAAYFQRVRSTCNNTVSGIMFQNLFSDGLTSYQNCLSYLSSTKTYGIYSVTGLEGFTEDFIGDDTATVPDLPAFDREAVKRVYPDLPVDAFEDALESWLTNGQTALDALNAGQDSGEAGQLADAAVNSMKTYGLQILEYYTAKLSNE